MSEHSIQNLFETNSQKVEQIFIIRITYFIVLVDLNCTPFWLRGSPNIVISLSLVGHRLYKTSLE